MFDQKLHLGLIFELNKRISKKIQNDLIKKIPPIFKCSRLENYKILINVLNEETKRNGVFSIPHERESSYNSITKKDTGIKSTNESIESKERIFDRCSTSVKIHPFKTEEENVTNIKNHYNNSNFLKNSKTFLTSSHKTITREDRGNNYNSIISNRQFHIQDSIMKGNDYKLYRHFTSIGNLNCIMK